jgi:hypothetical protein
VLSQYLKKPVRVQYMRHEGIAWDEGRLPSIAAGPASTRREKSSPTQNIGKAFSRQNIATNEGKAAHVLAGHLLGYSLAPEQSFEVPAASYTFEHKRVGWEVIPPLMDRASPLRTTHLRDPYGPPILFGSESFIDEVAAAPQAIPSRSVCAISPMPATATRLRRRRRNMAGMDAPPRNDQRMAAIATGRGIAFRRHFDTFIALIAEVRVHRDSGRIEIMRYVCAHDCGLVVNPETLRHVIDRQLVYGTSRTLFEEVRFDANMVTSVDWLTYPVLHMDSVPHSIESSPDRSPMPPLRGQARWR